MAITRRQHELYDFISRFVAERGYSPSFEEIAEGLGLNSLATVHKHVSNLEKKGLLTRDYNRSRSIETFILLYLLTSHLRLSPSWACLSLPPRFVSSTETADSPSCATQWRNRISNTLSRARVGVIVPELQQHPGHAEV